MTAIHLMENHDAAYYCWRDGGVKQRILIHIDAHHDLYGAWSTARERVTNIANYIFPALEEDLVREVFWIVPDQTGGTNQGRKDILRALRLIDGKNSKRTIKPRISNRRIVGAVLGKPLTVCTLADLPLITEPVLLDIDVDFLIIPNIAYRGVCRYGELPWCWPAELAARLAVAGVDSDFVTIAYSVEGGYTPLPWKYLGDELALRLQSLAEPEPRLQAAELMRKAILAACRGECAVAEACYCKAAELWPESAAPWYHLAHLYASSDRVAEAQACYRQALTADPSYRTAYQTSGLWYLQNKRLPAAERAFHRLLALDPEEPYAHLGLGLLAAQRKQWRESEAWLRRALAGDDKLVDAYRMLGQVLDQQRCAEEAIMAYERALKLTLAGYRALLDESIITHAREGSWTDARHAEIHNRLARLYARQGALGTAIQGYRIGIALGGDGMGARGHLVWLYLRQRCWPLSVRECWPLIKRIPVALKISGQQIRSRVKRFLRKVWCALPSFRDRKAGYPTWG